MSLTYKCKRCNYETNRYSNIVKHINIKKQCNRTIESYKYSCDQILILSLLPYINNNIIIKENDLDYLKDSNEIVKHKDELFLILDNVDKNKVKICNYCSKKYKKIIDIKQHILTSCFYENLEKDNKIKNVINNNITNNKNITINNITNNITHIHIDTKNIVPFDEDWDMSKIDELMKKIDL